MQKRRKSQGSRERKLRQQFISLFKLSNSQDGKKRAGREVKDMEQRDYAMKEGSRTSGKAQAQTEREGWQEEREHPLTLPQRKAGHTRVERRETQEEAAHDLSPL